MRPPSSGLLSVDGFLVRLQGVVEMVADADEGNINGLLERDGVSCEEQLALAIPTS